MSNVYYTWVVCTYVVYYLGYSTEYMVPYRVYYSLDVFVGVVQEQCLVTQAGRYDNLVYLYLL